MADDIIFNKQSSDGQKLVMSKKQVPYVPPTKEEIEELRKEFPGAEIKLDHKYLVYEYALTLVSSDGKQQKKLWLKQSTDFGLEPKISTEFKPFDAIFKSDTLLIIYKDTCETIADVVKPDQKKVENTMGGTGTVLSKDEPSAHTIVTSAKIEGSFKDDSIEVNLTFTDGKSTKWTFKKNAWAEVKIPEDVHAKDNYGRTPLFKALFEGSAQRVEELLKKGAKVDAKDNHGVTPLMYIVSGEQANIECVKTLLDNAAAVNTIDNQGWTPLMHATQGGNIEVVKLLIAHKADVNAKTKDGMYPLRLPIKRKDQAMIDLLKKAGAKE